MATRPQARAGLTGVHYWFILFVGLWLVSTVLLVILWTDQSKLKEERRRWDEDRARIVKPTETTQLQPWFAKSEAGGRSFVGVLNDERAAAVRLIAGDTATDLATAQKLLDEVLDRIMREGRVTDPSLYSPDRDLVTMMQQLYGDYVKNADLINALKAENDQLKREDLQRMQASADEKRQFQDAAAELEQRVQTLRQDYDDSVRDRQEQIQHLTENLTQSRDDASAEQRRMQQANEKLDEQVLRLGRTILDMRERQKQLYEADPAALLKQMDAEIVEVNMPAGVAYIDIGSKDRVIAGLTFEVYPPDGRINPDGSGKGTIEVISTGPDTAECQITRSRPEDPITVGDLVGNIVYDKHRTYRFVVLGGFDLNDDGKDDPDGAQVIQAVIQDWGGAVVDEVNEKTDFVVLGSEPNRPSVAADATAEEKARAAEQTKAHERYAAAYEQARVLAVPILNKTQFFNFLGFTGSVPR
jgi:hypothetical protein